VKNETRNKRNNSHAAVPWVRCSNRVYGRHGVDVMLKLLRRIFWPSNLISDDIPAIQYEIDAEHGIRPAPIEKKEFYRKLSEVPQ
jgi:hypothetical protein